MWLALCLSHAIAAPPARSLLRVPRIVPIHHQHSWRKIAISNNVGGVKRFSSTLRHALGEERHFALVEAMRAPTKARSQSLRSGTQSDPTISSITTAIMITTSNSSLQRSGTPINMLDVLLHTTAISGLSRVRTELDPTADNPIPDASSSTGEPPVAGPSRLWRFSVPSSSSGGDTCCATPVCCAP